MMSDTLVGIAVTAFVVIALVCQSLALLGLFQATGNWIVLSIGSLIVLATYLAGVCLTIEVWSD